MPRPKRPPPRRCWNSAPALVARDAATMRATATPRMIGVSLLPAVVDRVDRNLGAEVVARLERISRPRLRGDESCDLLRFFVGEAPGAEVRHRVADDAGERVDARRAGAVVPGSIAPQGASLLVADLYALAVWTVARRAALGVDA